MTDELKACPFCGARQLTDAEAGETLPYQGEYRACDECGCVSRDWNHRPIEDAQAAEIERLNELMAGHSMEWALAMEKQDVEIERLKQELQAAENWIKYQKHQIEGLEEAANE